MACSIEEHKMADNLASSSLVAVVVALGSNIQVYMLGSMILGMVEGTVEEL